MIGPRVGALFAGYGGIELALHDVPGAEPAWFSEIEPAPSRMLAHRYPGVPNHGDITKIRWEDVEPVDIITGGSPCQDLSHAGKRAGMRAGTRSGLWASRVLGDLAELGYDAAWCGLRAADVGAPHGRFRVFVLAWPADTESRPGRLGNRTALHAWRAADRRASDTGASGPVTWGSREWRDLTLLPTPAVNDMGASYTPETWDAWTARMKAAHGNGNGHGASLSIEALRMLPTPVTAYTASTAEEWRARRPAGNGGTREQIGDLRIVVEETDFGQYAPAIARWEALTRPAPPPTEPTGKGGAHRLSPRFVEWLMGLPDGWVTGVPGVTRNDQLKALGNGVVPQQCAAAVRYLLSVRDTAEGVAA